MIKTYLKQAWTMMKQNRLFTSIYVIGTGLSIALTMTLFIILYVKFAPIYPEYNRNRTMVIKGMMRSLKDNQNSFSINNGSSLYFVKELLPTLEHAEAIAGVVPGMGEFTETFITLPTYEQMRVSPCYTNGGFWQVFTFDFIAGEPYTTEEADATLPVAVLSQTTAKRIFASTDVVGKHFMFNGKDFRVCGVVADVSNATPETAGDLWIPLLHSIWVSRENVQEQNDLIGSIVAHILVKDGETDALKAEVEELIEKHNQQNPSYVHNLLGQPYIYWQSSLRGWDTKPLDLWQALRPFIYMIIALLFIPALNLSGMISSRMDARLCELGVRKAYGATNLCLVGQILWENLLLTCLGGLLGLLLAYFIVYTSSDWILYLFDNYIMNTQGVSLQPHMLFNPWLFAVALSLCLLLNLISALIPTFMALRKTIISSIHAKR